MTRWILEPNPEDVGNVSSGFGLACFFFSFLASARLFFFFYFSNFQSKGCRGQLKSESNPSRQRELYHISNSHTPAAARSARACLTANSQRGLRKGQKQRGQLVFSQLICQSGPQTSEHITVFLPDKSRWRGGRWGVLPWLVAPPIHTHAHTPPSHSPPSGQKNSDGPGLRFWLPLIQS